MPRVRTTRTSGRTTDVRKVRTDRIIRRLNGGRGQPAIAMGSPTMVELVPATVLLEARAFIIVRTHFGVAMESSWEPASSNVRGGTRTCEIRGLTGRKSRGSSVEKRHSCIFSP